MKLTAPIAIPTPKTMPASRRLEPPSPKANVTPPTTIETRLRPRAIGPVKLVMSTLTAFSHGEACAKLHAGTRTIAANAMTSARRQRCRRHGAGDDVTYESAWIMGSPPSRAFLNDLPP